MVLRFCLRRKVVLRFCLRRKDKKVMQNEEERGPVITTVFKVRTDSDGCNSKIKKLVRSFEGVTDIAVDNMKDLVSVTGTMDNIALANHMMTKLKIRVEVVPPNNDKEDKQSNEVGNGDGDNNSGGRAKNKTTGGGGDGDSDGDDGDQAEGGGGGGKMEAGFKLDSMGEGGLGYRYAYHAGFENGYPVGQLHVAHKVNGDNLNGKEDKQSNKVGNGYGDGSSSDNDNNNGSGDKNKKKADRGGGWIRKTRDVKILYMGQLGFGDGGGGGQLLVAPMFCRGNLNTCSAVRSVVLF